MADQRVKEIGEEELRFVLKTQSRKAVLAKVIKKLCNTTTLPGLLSSRNGNLCVAGVEATAEIRKIVDDAVKNSSPVEELRGSDKGELISELIQVIAHCRKREGECYNRQQIAVGVKKGSPLDEEALWGGLAAQRLGRQVPEGQRGSTELLKKFNDGLSDPIGRRLAAVDLLKVKSAADTNALAKAEEAGEEVEKKKSGKVTLRSAQANLHMIFMTLAAVSSCEIEVGAEGSPEVRRGEGKVMLPGSDDASSSRTLDASLVECEAAVMYILDHHAHEEGDVAALASIFNRFWAAMTKSVSWSGKQKRCIAGAIEDAKTLLDTSDAVLEQVQKEERKRKAEKQPADTPAPKTKAATRAAKKKDEEKKPNKKEEKKKQETPKSKGPHSTGDICNRYRTDPKSCPFGKKCIHKHLNPGDDSEDDDVRERD